MPQTISRLWSRAHTGVFTKRRQKGPSEAERPQARQLAQEGRLPAFPVSLSPAGATKPTPPDSAGLGDQRPHGEAEPWDPPHVPPPFLDPLPPQTQ